MKIAITADCHLRSDNDRPARYAALENILEQMLALEIGTLMVAGDLFDRDANNYAAFEKLLGQERFSGLKIIAIRGNHDVHLRGDDFTSKNFQVIETWTWMRNAASGVDFLLIPYMCDVSMAEALEQAHQQYQPAGGWALIAHGSYLPGSRDVDPYERGVYMPLMGADLQRYRPARVFLGHTHKAYHSRSVVIPGSPCGMDITESGKRTFIAFDTASRTIERRTVDSETIYMDETITITPGDDVAALITGAIEAVFAKWDIAADERTKVVMRLRVNGYTAHIQQTKGVIEETLQDIKKYQDAPIDYADLKISRDLERDFIVKQFEAQLKQALQEQRIDSGLKDAIRRHALDLIYGE